MNDDPLVQTMDLDIDREFGMWLQTLRIRKGLTVGRAAVACGIVELRLRTLESGWGKGIKRDEAIRISRLYGINILETFKRAQGEWSEVESGTS